MKSATKCLVTRRREQGATAMFQMSDTIRKSETADRGILPDLQHGQMFRLNLAASKIVELLQHGYDEALITEEISREYGHAAGIPGSAQSQSPNR